MARNLEDVESFKLDVSAFLLEHVHHQLEIVSGTDVARHDGEVMAVQQQLTQQLHTHTQWKPTSTYTHTYTHTHTDRHTVETY